MPSSHESLRNEAAHRALCDAFFSAVAGRVVGADLCYEIATRAEASRELDGTRSVLGHAAKGGLVARLIGAAGRNLEVSLGEPGPMDVKLRVEEALEVLQTLPPDPSFRLAELPDRTRRHFGAPSPPSPTQQRAASRMTALFDHLEQMVERRAAGAVLLDHRVRVYTEIEEKVVCDDRGLWRTQSIPQSFLQLELLARRGDARARWVQRVGKLDLLDGLVGPDGKPKPDVQASLDAALTRVVELLDARPLSEIERAALTHVVVDASAMVFVHEACGHNFEADLVLAGRSGLFTADARPVAERFGSAAVRLVDGPPVDGEGRLQPGRGFGTQFIDDEGVEVEAVVLLDRGVPSACMHDRETAGRLGIRSNGHGFSELGQPRLVRMTNTYLLPAGPEHREDDVERFLDGITLGLWVEGSNGGQVSGDGMSSSVQAARVIRDGRLTNDWIRPGTLTVRTLGALLGIEAFHGPPVIERPGFCGKGQTKTVTEGGCTARIRLSDDFTVGF